MADISSEAKVNMSLDEIIKMEKKKKINNKNKRGGGAIRGGRGNNRGNTRGNMRNGTRGNVRNGVRGNMRRSRSTVRGGGGVQGRSRSASRGRPQNFNKQRGGAVSQWRKFSQNRGSFRGKSNLTRSRSNLSLNQNKGGFIQRRGGARFGLMRSRSRTNLSRTNFMVKNRGLQRTSSMPNLSDPSSVYNRLGYQSPAQIAYRNRVKRAKSVLLQRQNKAMRMANAFMLSPGRPKNMAPMKQPLRRNSISTLHSDQLMHAQRRSQYEQKLMRMQVARSTPSTSPFMTSFNDIYGQQHPAMALYQTSPSRNSIGVTQRRGRSPFRRALPNIKPDPGYSQVGRSASVSRQRRRSRSRSRSRAQVRRNSFINMMDTADFDDRHFSEIMYSLSNNFGVTGRTLNDRFT